MATGDGGADGSAGTAGSVVLRSPLGRRVLATAVIGSAVAMLTATVVNVALPRIALDFDASTAEQQWVANSYLLSLASLILLGGSAGDRYGRVRVFRLGIVVFGAASLACALAPSVEWLIGMRLLQGVGAALSTPGSLAIIEATLRPDDRGAGIGAWSGLGGIAGAVGPLLGGVLVDVASWRWVFLLNLPLVVAVLAVSRSVPETTEGDEHGRLDRLGVVGSVVVLGAAAYALIQGPDAPTVGVSLGIAAAVVAVALVAHERRHPNPILPVDLLADRGFAAANLVTLVLYGGMGIVFFLLSVHLQVVGGFSPVTAGAALLPATLLMLLFSARAGDLARRIGPRVPLTVGPLTIAGGMLLLRRASADPSFVRDVLPAVVVFGIGLVATVAPVTSAALDSAPDARVGAASGFNNAVARTGGLLTVAGIPPLVGLTGTALSDPVALADRFDDAVTVGAGLVVLSAVVAATMLRQPVSPTDERDVCGGCPVDGPPATVAAQHAAAD